MILKRHGRRFVMTRRSPSTPPPLPFQLVFADELESGEDQATEEWETVEDDELEFRAELPADSTGRQSPALVVSDIPDDAARRGDPLGDGAALNPGTRKWVQLTAVLALSVMALAAAWLPVRRPSLPSGVSLPPSQVLAPAEPVVYVVPVTIIGHAPGSQTGSGQELAVGQTQEE